MRFQFNDEKLQLLYETDAGVYKAKFPAHVIDQFFVLMSIIAASVDERNLRARKGRRFEKLQGDLKGLYSMRLDRQYRLIFAINEDQITIMRIEDYH